MEKEEFKLVLLQMAVGAIAGIGLLLACSVAEWLNNLY